MSLLTEERHRLVALRRQRILDTPREEAFDMITSSLARLLDVPYACVSLVDEIRVWFKSTYGIDVVEVPRESGLCTTAIESNRVRYIEDASKDAETRHNSLVAGDGIRFYVGAPLITADGFRIGTLCAFGPEPRKMTQDEVETVEHLATLVMHEIVSRRERGVIDAEPRGTILVIDDDDMILTLIRRALERAGFRVLTAGTGRATVQLLAENEFKIDAAILDTTLPEQDFVMTHAALTAVSRGLPVILSGWRASDQAIGQFVDTLSCGFLDKPFGPDELLAVVRGVVRR